MCDANKKVEKLRAADDKLRATIERLQADAVLVADELAKAEHELAEEEAKNMSYDKQLAIQLHELMCHHNHTDGCSWYYFVNGNVHNWEDHAHREYLAKARAAIDVCNKHAASASIIIDMVNALKVYK